MSWLNIDMRNLLQELVPVIKAVRNMADLDCMAVPAKYRRMMTFYKYYKGEEVAPIPTLFSKRLFVA